MSFPSHAGHSHVLPSHTHTMHTPDPTTRGFRGVPIQQEDLAEGEVLCDVCNGFGYENNPHFGPIICKKCQGAGKLDWIERIVGKKEDPFTFSSYSGVTSYAGISGWQGLSGASGTPGVSGVPGLSGFIHSHSHTVQQQNTTTGSILHNQSENEIEVFDGEKWVKPGAKIKPEAKKTIGNKFMNGLKKLFKGVYF